MEKFRFGSVFYNGKPVGPNEPCSEEVLISIGDTQMGLTLDWFPVFNKLVGPICCLGCSWRQLNRADYIFGRPIRIDGKSYWCRSLSIGQNLTEPSEYNGIIKRVGASPDIWNCNGHWAWGQETMRTNDNFGICRGGPEENGFNYATISYSSDKIGFRPVLEPLQDSLIPDKSLIGRKLNLYMIHEYVRGILVDYSDYDLTVQLDAELHAEFPWAQPAGKETIIDRSAITWIG